jgi:hypothetical protein
MNKLNEMYAALPGIVWEVPSALHVETLVVGMKVRVKYGADECEDATIQKVNEDETFDIVLDDGHYGTRKNVPLNEIRIQNVSGVYSYFILFCSVFSLFVFRTPRCCFAHTSSFLLFSLFFYSLVLSFYSLSMLF